MLLRELLPTSATGNIVCTVGGTSSELAVRVLLTPPQVELVSLGKTAIDLPALRGPLWVLMKPEFISLDGVRDPVEGLVVAGVEPVFASYLGQPSRRIIEDWQCQQRSLHERFRLREPGWHQFVTRNSGGLKFNGAAVRTAVRHRWL